MEDGGLVEIGQVAHVLATLKLGRIDLGIQKKLEIPFQVWEYVCIMIIGVVSW